MKTKINKPQIPKGIKQLSQTQRWVLYHVTQREVEIRARTGSAQYKHEWGGGAALCSSRTNAKLETLGYVRTMKPRNLRDLKRWTLTPQGRALGLQIERWMAGQGDPPGTPYTASYTDERGNRCDVLANAGDDTLFVTVARKDDDDISERVFEVGCGVFFAELDEIRSSLRAYKVR